jgi:hypothetical protein
MSEAKKKEENRPLVVINVQCPAPEPNKSKKGGVLLRLQCLVIGALAGGPIVVGLMRLFR